MAVSLCFTWPSFSGNQAQADDSIQQISEPLHQHQGTGGSRTGEIAVKKNGEMMLSTTGVGVFSPPNHTKSFVTLVTNDLECCFRLFPLLHVQLVKARLNIVKYPRMASFMEKIMINH